jgi:hypothetical protein
MQLFLHSASHIDRLKGKRALITGGTSGIGLETARRFVNEAARVAVTGRTLAAFEFARKELGAGVLAILSDAGDVACQRDVAETLRRECGKLDILFVNAGVAELKPVEQWAEATPRQDPLMGVRSGKRLAGEEPLAGKNTLNRLELSTEEPNRYKKIHYRQDRQEAGKVHTPTQHGLGPAVLGAARGIPGQKTTPHVHAEAV